MILYKDSYLKQNESLFFTNDEGKPLCSKCCMKPIVCETNFGWRCLDCAFELIEEFGIDEIESDESMIVCERELKLQS